MSWLARLEDTGSKRMIFIDFFDGFIKLYFEIIVLGLGDRLKEHFSFWDYLIIAWRCFDTFLIVWKVGRID